jgi:hypothetical protein
LTYEFIFFLVLIQKGDIKNEVKNLKIERDKRMKGRASANPVEANASEAGLKAKAKPKQAVTVERVKPLGIFMRCRNGKAHGVGSLQGGTWDALPNDSCRFPHICQPVDRHHPCNPALTTSC